MFFKVEEVSKFYNGKKILHEISFNLNKGELVSIIGPSGAGKTTLLKLIAGLEPYDSGKIIHENSDRKKNQIILVFQDYVLFPFMNVFDNIAFGLKNRKEKKITIKEKVLKFLDYFHLADIAHSFPNQISAGQKQRVAIARSLIINPYMLLLDEPFANLDKNLKLETAEFIRSTQKKFNITTIVVTHDQEEAYIISDKLGVMLDGRLTQFGKSTEIYYNPASYDIAKFLGHVNIIPKNYFEYLNIDSDLVLKKENIYTRSESLDIIKDEKGYGEVIEVSFAGNYILYSVKIKDLILKIRRINDSLNAGDRVKIKLLRFFDKF